VTASGLWATTAHPETIRFFSDAPGKSRWGQLLAIIEKRIFLNGGRTAIVEESLGMGQSTGYDGRNSRTDTRSAASEWPRK